MSHSAPASMPICGGRPAQARSTGTMSSEPSPTDKTRLLRGGASGSLGAGAAGLGAADEGGKAEAGAESEAEEGAAARPALADWAEAGGEGKEGPEGDGEAAAGASAAAGGSCAHRAACAGGVHAAYQPLDPRGQGAATRAMHGRLGL